jgi:hypothetical protein
MGQPSRLPETNVVFFPQARRDEDLQSKHQRQAHRDEAVGSQRPHGVVSDYAIVSLKTGDRTPILLSVPSVQLVSSPSLLFLITALVLLALLPTLGMAVLWVSGSPRAQASVENGTEVVITLATISVPTVLEARAGEKTPFPIAIDAADWVETDSRVVVSRLPQGSTFSAGRISGETAWILAPGETKDLQLVLPGTAHGETALMIQLVAADGHLIDDAATIVEVYQPSSAEIAVRRITTQVVRPTWDQEPSEMGVEIEAPLEARQE